MTVEFPSMQPGWIAYVGPFAFPRAGEAVESGAAARRVLGISQSVAGSGTQVLILSGQQVENDAVEAVAPGIWHLPANERTAEHLPRALRYLRYASMGKRTVDILRSIAVPPSAVILYSGYTPFLIQLTRWGKKSGIPIIFDAVEWYTSKTPAGFFLSPYLWNTEFAMRCIVPRLDGVITISRYLEEYYRQRGVSVIRLPPTLDCAETLVSQAPSGQGPVRLSYTGSAYHDHLDLIISTLLEFDPDGVRIRLDVAGPSRAELDKLPALRRFSGRALPKSLRVHGRVPHETALEITRSADFSVFLRTSNKTTIAGFPTKFVESMAVGTPVISTLSSNIGDYLSDGTNGIIVSGLTKAAVAEAFGRICEMGIGHRNMMRASARKTAEASFDYRNYVELIAGFVGGLAVDLLTGDRPPLGPST